jgi:hypothetical protein
VKRLRAMLQMLGPAGVVGIGLLFLCAPLYWSSVRPAEQQLKVRRAAADDARKGASPYRPVGADARTEELRRFYDLFPSLDQLPAELERIYALARKAKLELLRGEYRMERREGLVPYHITLPLRGAYPQVREFIGATLQAMPNTSLDALRFERKKSGDAQLDSQVQLTVYFRSNLEGGNK